MTLVTATMTPDELEAHMGQTPLTAWVARANLIPVLAAGAVLWVPRERHNKRKLRLGAPPQMSKPLLQLFTTAEGAEKWAGDKYVADPLSLLQACELVVTMDMSGAYIDGRHGEQFNIGPTEALYIHHGFWPAPLDPGARATEPVIPAHWKATVAPASPDWKWLAERAVEIAAGLPEISTGYLAAVAMNGRPPIHVVFLETNDGVSGDAWKVAAQKVQDGLGTWPVIERVARPVLVWGMVPGMADAVRATVPPFYVAAGTPGAAPRT